MQEIDSNIFFGNSAKALDKWFQSHKYSAIHVLCDENTFRDCWPKLNNVDWPLKPSVSVIAAGELSKNLKTCETVWDAFIEQSVDRNSLLINLGGGVVTDLGGFCAASFMRGIRFLHIPTSVLAMTDAAIGGKHGVDFRLYKNYIGTFAEPECVIVDPSFIQTLDSREVRSGLAEVAKHGFLADPELISILQKCGDPIQLEWHAVLRRSLEVKLGFVRNDVHDRGIRAALNFGHTIGHAIETHQLNTEAPLRHGEAVAIGMLVEGAISTTQLGLDDDEYTLIESTVRTLFPGLKIPEITPEKLQKLIFKDKKKSGNDVLFSLLAAIGTPVVGQIVSSSTVNEAYLHYNS